MMCVTVAFILDFPIVSPFSSALLALQYVLSTQDAPFAQTDISSVHPPRLVPKVTTYYQAMSNILLYAITSTWFTEKYVIIPF